VIPSEPPPVPTPDDGVFNDRDREQLAELGISLAEAHRQLALFEDPPPPARLVGPARLGEGLLQLSEARHGELIERFEGAMAEGAVRKLVPASGAATRMFKSLTPLLDDPPEEPGEEAREVFAHLDRFAFYEDLTRAAERRGLDLAELRARRDHPALAELLLTSRGLGYLSLPKGLIPFHRYPDGSRTAFEEQLLEGAAYARDRHGLCHLHFTVTPDDEPAFRRLLGRVAPELGERLGTRFVVGFSHQSHATDTLAVDLDNRPFRLEDGSLLLRPGGHGALIGNLHALAREGADLEMIKNIDNVVPDDRRGEVGRWKKLLGGLLLEVRERLWGLLERLEAPRAAADGELLEEASAWLAGTLGRPLPQALETAEPERLRAHLIDRLDRPLRVCGMVANRGEPGGGPFWVESGGEVSLQIVEKAQIDFDAPDQRQIVARATHFNPVDLACSLRDRHGEPYDLERFIDPRTVFIARKTHHGEPIQALERPGLWNGAMAGWNSVFVEVPITTFSPVKTVADLLRPAHQVGSGG
jgi:hypothetical protein